MRSTDIQYTHPDYDNNKDRWEFYLRSYMGGEDYKNGGYLTKYINEDKDSYARRIDLTPIDNHCKNIVHIYSSFLWRIPPVRQFNSIAEDQVLAQFIKDSDLDGKGFDAGVIYIAEALSGQKTPDGAIYNKTSIREALK